MRIVFLHRWIGVHEGGTETHIRELIRFLSKNGHEVSLITREGRRLVGLKNGVRIFRVAKIPFESDFSYKSMYDPRLYFYTLIFMILLFIKFAELYFKGERFDILSVHFLTESKVARLIRLLFGVPYVFSLEGYTPLEAAEARKANQAFAVSENIAGECRKNFGYSPIVKTHGVDRSVFNDKVDGTAIRNRYRLAQKFIFLTVCRLEPRKDIPTLLKAAKSFLLKHPNAVFLVVGKGIQSEELRVMAEDLGVGGGVIFAGSVTDSELPLFYAAADVFVLPTLYEGFGIVYGEAMSTGLPIISTTAGAVPEVVGEAGLLFTPKDTEALENLLEKIYNDKQLRQTLKEKALFRAAALFDSEKLLRIYEEGCRGVLKKGV